MSSLTDEEIDALWPDITLPQKAVRREIVRKGIAANNAKVLKDLKPELLAVQSAERGLFFVVEEGHSYQESAVHKIYSADQVAALMQERDSFKEKNCDR